MCSAVAAAAAEAHVAVPLLVRRQRLDTAVVAGRERRKREQASLTVLLERRHTGDEGH
jgi:hypothetical protein